MKQIRQTANGMRRVQIWFNDKERLEDIDVRGADLLEFKESSKKLTDAFHPFRNGIVDLEKDEEALFEGLTKGFRYEVRRAQKDGFSAGPYQESLETVQDEYRRFSEAKGLTYFPAKMIRSYADSGNLAVTCARLPGEADPIQYHMYFHDDGEAILLASFPGKERPGIEPKHFGFANRLLHWQDILGFKRMGLHRYNLGGIGNPGSKGNENILKFKMEMSPEIEYYYHAVVPVSWRARMYMKMRGLLKGRP